MPIRRPKFHEGASPSAYIQRMLSRNTNTKRNDIHFFYPVDMLERYRNTKEIEEITVSEGEPGKCERPFTPPEMRSHFASEQTLGTRMRLMHWGVLADILPTVYHTSFMDKNSNFCGN